MGLFDAISAPITAGITSAAQIAATNSTNQTNLRMNAENNALQKELAQYSYEQQREMIREQNEYNSPENQMQRYLDAGLNPNLIYGQISPGQQSEIAKYDAPETTPGKVSPIDFLQIGNLVTSSIKAMNDIEAQQLANEERKQIMEQRGLAYEWEKFLSGLPSIFDSIENSPKQTECSLKLDVQAGRINKLNQEVLYQQERTMEMKRKFDAWMKEQPLRFRKLQADLIKAENYNPEVERWLRYMALGTMGSVFLNNISGTIGNFLPKQQTEQIMNGAGKVIREITRTVR